MKHKIDFFDMVVSKENKVYFMTKKKLSVFHVLVIAVLFQGLEREEFVDCNDLKPSHFCHRSG